MGIFDKFKLGLSRSSKDLSSGLNDLIFKKKIDKNILDELEDFLIQSDVGVEAAKEWFQNPQGPRIVHMFQNGHGELSRPRRKRPRARRGKTTAKLRVRRLKRKRIKRKTIQKQSPRSRPCCLNLPKGSHGLRTGVTKQLASKI